MKTILFSLLIIGSFSSYAKEAKKVTLNCGGEIRYGSMFGDSVSIPFDVLLQERLANNLVKVTKNNRSIDAEVSCNHTFNPNTFYSLRHVAEMTITVDLVEMNSQIVKTVTCSATVNDGGNQTLKKSCANKVAKTIRSILDKNL